MNEAMDATMDDATSACHYMDTACLEQEAMDAMDDATTCHYMDTDCLNQESSSQYDQD